MIYGPVLIYILALLIFHHIYHPHMVIPSHSAILSGLQLLGCS